MTTAFKELVAWSANAPADHADYFDRIATHHCPYINISAQESALFFREIAVGFSGNTPSESAIGSAVVEAVEILRASRAILSESGAHLRARLMCLNLIVAGSESLDELDAKRLLDWPHYVGKTMYAKVGVMLGKFWTHEKSQDRAGQNISEPPMSYISVRSAIPPRDPKLLSSEKYASLIETSKWSKDDLLFEATGVRTHPLSTLAQRIEEENLYQLLKERCKLAHPKH